MAWGFNNDRVRDQFDKVKESLKGTFGANTGNRPNGSTLGLTTDKTMSGNTVKGPSGGRATSYSTVNSRGQTVAGGGGNTAGGGGSRAGGNGTGSTSAGNPKGGGTNTNDPAHYKKGGLVKKRGWGLARTYKK